jgi:hypothetical protein
MNSTSTASRDAIDLFPSEKTKAQLLREQIEANPDKPNKQIAREVGAEPDHVRCERRKLEGDRGPPSSPEIPTEAEDFDWSDPEIATVVEQPRIAIYVNPLGQLVIRQFRWPDEDALIFISPDSLDTFLDRLMDVAGIPSVGRRTL